MRIRHLFLACLAVLLVIPAFTAAWAEDQHIEVTVVAADTLAISVETDFGLDIAVPGRISNDRGFWMGVTNTVVDQPWQITVDAQDLVRFTWGEPCDDQGNCTRIDTTDTIAKTNLYLKGGYNDWTNETGDPIFTSNESYLPSSGGMWLTRGTADAYGSFGFDQNPSIRLDAPAEVGTDLGPDLGDYHTTVTYTIAAQP
jgi:hypothetical protein